jgi:pimeloyl-ACP methyl ester carboxylesterase
MKHIFYKIRYLFKSINFSDLTIVKNKWDYLNNEVNLLTPIVISGKNSDLSRTKLGTIKQPLRQYHIDSYQSVKFKLHSKHQFSIKNNLKSQNIWIVTHGFADRIDGDFDNIAKHLADNKPDDIILSLDWSDIAVGSSPAFSLDVYRVATWLNSMARELHKRLELWGIDSPQQVNIIGHSLGSILATEIGRVYYNNNNQKINTLIALDPPSELTAIQYDQEHGLYLTQSNPKIARVYNISDIADYSIALIGNNSIAGNTQLAKSAHYSYLVKFNHFLEFKRGHNWVVSAFAQMIQHSFIFDKVENLHHYLVNNKLVLTNNKSTLLHDAVINYKF